MAPSEQAWKLTSDRFCKVSFIDLDNVCDQLSSAFVVRPECWGLSAVVPSVRKGVWGSPGRPRAVHALLCLVHGRARVGSLFLQSPSARPGKATRPRDSFCFRKEGFVPHTTSHLSPDGLATTSKSTHGAHPGLLNRTGAWI